MSIRPEGAFTLLCERLRHGIVHTLGWRELRPVQEESIRRVLGGNNAIIIAPTAGGKTEAAMLPVIEGLATGRVLPVGALYLSPLKALLNNQEPRMARLASLAGLSAFKWHGDVGADRKRRFSESPSEILMITPESLEVILASPRYDKKALFGALHYVVIDEIHAFAGDDRGDHLTAILERILEYADQDFQRIGLSATVGNPGELLRWLQGSSRRQGSIIQPERSASPRVIEIHPLADGVEPSRIAANLAKGKKSLFFAESRSNTERLKKDFSEMGLTAFVHHSSVSKEIREDAERAFRDGAHCSIICTSTMELGLDVGDLDMVLQLHAPSTVSAFLQRMGRTGRRPGTKGHMVFITDEEWTFLQAAALVSLAMRGFVEPVAFCRRSVHVYLHQALARILERSGERRNRLVAGAGSPMCFADLPHGEREEILSHLVTCDILNRADGLLTFGPAGEKAFGFAHFRELYSVFDSPKALQVRTTDNKAIGTLEMWFAQALRADEFLFVLGGKPWLTVNCDWEQGVITVKPGPAGKIPSWMGAPRLLSRELCEEMRTILIESGELPFLGDHAARCLDRLREKWGALLRLSRLVLQRKGDELFLYTFAGGRINNVLGKVIERETRLETSINNFWVRTPLPDSDDFAEPILRSLSRVKEDGYFSQEALHDIVAALPRGRLSKFQQYLPPRLEERFLAERLLDVEGAGRLCGERIAIFAAGY